MRVYVPLAVAKQEGLVMYRPTWAEFEKLWNASKLLIQKYRALPKNIHYALLAEQGEVFVVEFKGRA